MSGPSEMILDTSTPPVETPVDEAPNYGGYESVEELVAAYEAAKAPKVTEAPKTVEVDEAPSEDEVTNALTSAGLDQDVFTKEFAETGELSAESFEALEKAGFPKAMVETYVRGLQADNAAYEAAVYGPVGGADGYGQLIAWATDNATPEEKKAFNDAVTSNDPTRAAMAVQALASKMGGNRPKMLHGKTGSSVSNVKPFESLSQVTVAKRDPRYRTDPAYRKEISERLRASTAL